MRTEQAGPERYRQTDTRPWTDASGFTWKVEVHYYDVRGRYEPTRVVLDSGGYKPVTSTVLRAFEQELTRRRTVEAESLAVAVANGSDAIKARAQRQLDRWRAEAPPSKGKRRDDDLWLARVVSLYMARVEGRPLNPAMVEWESWRLGRDVSVETAKTLIRRARAWDREVGLNLITSDEQDPTALKRALQYAREHEHPLNPGEKRQRRRFGTVDQVPTATPRSPR